MKYFIYCRKSSENEDRQVLSIDSQRVELQRTFGSNSALEIVEVIEESFSAKAPGRAQFNKMIARIERGEADGIIAWHPDRLARNSVDGGRIIYLLDQLILKDLKFATFTFENNPQGKFMLSIIFGYSKYYVDSLSENVKRGNRAKAERGWRPNHAPLGYLNDRATSTITKDPERFASVRRMFELMLTGAYSPRRICEIARYEWGFRTPKRKRVGGKAIALSAVYKILSNPFYAGILIWSGKTYQGAHEPIVSIREFERVQMLLNGAEKPRPHTKCFPFTGMIRCGRCGLLVTAEEKVNRYGSRYVYYHCTKRRIGERCDQRSIRAEELDAQIEQFLEGLSLPTTLHNWALKQLRAAEKREQDDPAALRQTLQRALDDTTRALVNLTSLRVRDLVTDEEFIRERQKFERDQLRLRQELHDIGRTARAFEPGSALLSFNHRATEWLRTGDCQTKRLILQSVGSNPTLKDKKLSIEAKKPFRRLAKNLSFPQLCAGVEDIRALYTAQDPELLGILDNIRKLEIMFESQPADEPHRPAA